MMLYIRMALYFVSAALAGAGIAQFDPVANTLTIDLENAGALIATGVTAFAGTFAASRIAKAKGGKT